VTSLPTDWFFTRHHRRPLAFITTKRRRKKNGEKATHIGDFSVVSLTLFQLIFYFQGCRAYRDIAADRWIFIPPPPSPTRVYQIREETQKEW
jgi:hypothetical protein